MGFVSIGLGLFGLTLFGLGNIWSSSYSMKKESENYTICKCLSSLTNELNNFEVINCSQNKSCIYRKANCDNKQVQSLCQKWNSSIGNLNATNHWDNFQNFSFHHLNIQ